MVIHDSRHHSIHIVFGSTYNGLNYIIGGTIGGTILYNTQCIHVQACCIKDLPTAQAGLIQTTVIEIFSEATFSYR